MSREEVIRMVIIIIFNIIKIIYGSKKKKGIQRDEHILLKLRVYYVITIYILITK